MNYFVTGGTGFIGRFLLPRLLERGGTVYLLVRAASRKRARDLAASFGEAGERLIPVTGDLRRNRLGLKKKQIDDLRGRIDHFFHLAAIYDLKADEESQLQTNVEGTRHALALAKTLEAGCFHHVSSIAAAGLYPGVFTEDMFEEATGTDQPYYKTKHDSEGLVRQETEIPWKIYRPGMVVGHSQTGEMDKIDGPYYFFEAIRSMGRHIPSWLPLFSIRGGMLNIVPVDYVADAMDHLAHLPDQDNRCYFLTHPEGISVGDLAATLSAIANGPHITMPLNSRQEKRLLRAPGKLLKSTGRILPLDKVTKNLLQKWGLPPDILQFVDYPTRFDSRATHALLKEAGIVCPDVQDYAGVLWQYWEKHLRHPRKESTGGVKGNALLHPVRYRTTRVRQRQLHQVVDGKIVVVTGATSGIGRDCAFKLAAAGATVILAARTVGKLDDTLAEIRARGGDAYAYSCDLAKMEDCDRFVESVIKNHKRVDILINNAGRSIRRSVEYSFDRFHDFERTMQLNYFGALRLILGFSPVMLENRQGHILNLSSIGVLASPPRFSAYVASKSALDAFSWCTASEFSDRNVRFTTINMPLVKTPMIAPTRMYDAFPTLTPDEASDLVMKAIIDQPMRVATPLGLAGAVAQAVTPKTSRFILNQGYRLFPDTANRDGLVEEAGIPTNKVQLARRLFSQMFSGIHW